MSYSDDAAEQVVRMTLEGAEVAARITGRGAREAAVLLYAVLKDQKKTKGRARLTSMLRSGKELKVFAVEDGDLVRFSRAAKQYGVLYCVLKDRDAKDGITDVLVRAEDAAKINRIFERFRLSTVDVASVRSEIQRSRAERGEEQDGEDIFLEAIRAEGGREEPNPTQAREAGPSRSGTISGPNGSPEAERGRSSSSEEARTRPSVRQELRDIRTRLERENAARAGIQQTLEHLAPGKTERRKER